MNRMVSDKLVQGKDSEEAASEVIQRQPLCEYVSLGLVSPEAQ